MGSAISLKGLTVTYPQTVVPALDHIDLDISKGERVGIIGKSGSGKSTMLKCLNGIVPQIVPADMKGAILVDGVSTENMLPNELASKVGLVFEDPETQIVAPTVSEDITFGPINLGLPREEVLKRLDYGLEVSRLRDAAKRSPTMLSGGQKQSLVVGGILAMYPTVLALDEPLTGLDPTGKERVVRILKEYTQRNADSTLVISEGGTNIDYLIDLVDRLVAIHNGKVVHDGTVDEVLSNRKLFDSEVVSPPQLVEISNRLGLPSLPRTVDDAVPLVKSMVQKRKRADAVATPSATTESRRPIIEVKNLHHVYPPNVNALDGVSINIYDGEFLALIGQNGSGKTTLAYHLAGLLKATKGFNSHILIDGKSIDAMPVAELRKYVGYVFQNPRDQFFAQTVHEEIAYSLVMRGTPREQALEEARKFAETYHFNNLLEASVPQLSRAEASVVAMFAIAIAKPRVMIVDEPAGGADEFESRRLYTDLRNLKASGMTIVVITHDMKRTLEFAERVVVMNNGRILIEGDPFSVFRERETLSQAWIKPPVLSELEAKLQSETGIVVNARTATELRTMLTGDAS
ncbi:MAG TPA: ABC transporter ATP-binding protein [Nitrososphaerales archaeon]|nr:ABC transporter ATP-binding protein [Nitrososphaerales archaeon]